MEMISRSLAGDNEGLSLTTVMASKAMTTTLMALSVGMLVVGTMVVTTYIGKEEDEEKNG